MRAGPAAPDESIAWIRQSAVPLLATAPTADDSDLASFAQHAGTAQVVALGEATHGTHEFFRLKHRFLRHLVEKQGFRTFAMEADGAESCDLDTYIRTGQGEAAQEVRDLKFWTWQTNEFVEMIEWMRSYNASVSPDQAVRFHGIDMQNPAALSQRVLKFLGGIDPAAAQRANLAYGCLGSLDDREALSERYRNQEAGDQIRCASEIEEVHQSLLRNRLQYQPVSAAYECALWSSKLMISAEALLRFPSTRDRYYAENVLSLLGTPEERKKIVLWAHNGHVANSPGTMGRRLKRSLEEDYLIVGLTFYGGSFRARPRLPQGSAPPGPPVSITAPPPSPDSYEAAFHRAGLPRFVLDLRSAKADAHAPAWLAGPHPLWDIGGSYSPAFAASPSRLPEEYDLLVFLDHTEASKPLPRGQRKPGETGRR